MRWDTTPCKFSANCVIVRPDRAGALGVLIAAFALISSSGCARQSDLSERRADSQAGAIRSASGRSAENRTVPVKAVEWTSFPWKPRARARDWDFLVIHHTATDAGSVESIHRAHLEKRDADGNPWRGIGYHFVIGNGRGMEDGAIEPTFRWREQLAGAHASVGNYNEQGIGVCLVGNFEKESPTAAQITSLKRLVALLSDEYKISAQRVLRHGDVKATACPGRLFPMQAIVPVASSILDEDRRVSSADL